MYRNLIIFSSFLVLNIVLISGFFFNNDCNNDNCCHEKNIKIEQKTINHKSCISKEHNDTQNKDCSCIHCFEYETKYLQQVAKILTVYASKTAVFISYNLRIEQQIDCLIPPALHTLSTLDYFIKTIRLQI